MRSFTEFAFLVATGVAAICVSAADPKPDDRPQVWAFSCRDSCPKSVHDAVEKAKNEIKDADKELPFRVVWKDKWEPCVGGKPPGFWFHVSADQPTCADVTNTRVANGWPGIKDFTATWKYNRKPKK